MSNAPHSDTRLSTPKDGLQYLRNAIDKSSKYHSGAVKWFRKSHLMAQLGTALLSATITVVAGVKGSWLNETVANNVVIILGATTTVTAAWIALFSPRDSWQLYADTWNQLLALKARLDFTAANNGVTPLDQATIDDFFKNYQTILSDHEAKWQEMRKK